MADVNPSRLAHWVSALVRIPSVNPLHDGPKLATVAPPGERPLAEALAGWLTDQGAEWVELHDVVDGRPNVYGYFPGRSDRLAVLDVHTDTVTVENMVGDPFDGRVEDGQVWGRGALDTKASLGVILTLLESWAAAGRRPEPNLLVVGSISEESGGLLGASAFRDWADAKGLRPDELLVAEPTGGAPVYGHKGGVAARITVLGRSAHTATPQEGANAIYAMAPVIAALEAEHRRLIALPAATEVGTGTLTVTLIDGGTAQNVVPDRCGLTVGRRIAPYEDPAEEYERIVSIARDACPLPVDVEPVLHLASRHGPGSPAFYQSPHSPFIQSLAAWAGNPAVAAPYGTNALRYDDFAGAMAVFGPGHITDAHKETESVPIAGLEHTARVFQSWLNPQ